MYKLVFILLISGCAMFKTDPRVPEFIKKNKLAGTWKNSQGHFTIGCLGGFEYKEPQTWDNMKPKNSETGGSIRKFETEYRFKTGPVFSETHEINRMPYQDEQGKWWMEMNEKTWEKTQARDC